MKAGEAMRISEHSRIKHLKCDARNPLSHVLYPKANERVDSREKQLWSHTTAYKQQERAIEVGNSFVMQLTGGYVQGVRRKKRAEIQCEDIEGRGRRVWGYTRCDVIFNNIT